MTLAVLTWRHSAPFILLCIIVALGNGCTESNLQPINDVENIVQDNLLDIQGEVCTEPPKPTPFPVKIMFIVDSSGSMQFTDPSANTTTLNPSNNTTSSANSRCIADCDAAQQTCIADGRTDCTFNCSALCGGAQEPGRQAAVERILDRYRNNQNVYMSVLRFNGDVVVNGNTCEGFARLGTGGGTSCAQDGVDSLDQADITTDYEGAIGTAYNILLQDMIDADPVELTRTKYVVIFLSDGAPNPACQAGCDNDTSRFTAWCDIPRDEWCAEYGIGGTLCDNFLNRYPGVQEPCFAYNSDELILTRIKQIAELGRQFSVGELQFNTAFLSVPTLPTPILEIFFPPPAGQTVADMIAAAENRLQLMADAGGGFYRNFSSGQQIDFLDINLSSVERPLGMTNFMASNINTRPAVTEVLTDSDGDGLSDAFEFDAQLGLDRANPDTDGDGYNDKLEVDLIDNGYHPNDASKPAATCVSVDDRADTDGDGLNTCEERVLSTSPDLEDTDRDRIPDGVEFFFGTDPIRNDIAEDTDFDDKRNAEEIRVHADPNISDPKIHGDFKYLYDISQQPERVDRRVCYEFAVREIRLSSTVSRSGNGTNGYNTVLVYFGEGQLDDARDFGETYAACVRARYVEGSQNFKDPENGLVTLCKEQFLDLGELRSRLAAVQNASSLPNCDLCSETPRPPPCDPCAGVPAP